MTVGDERRTGIADVLLIWVILGFVAIEVLVTYTRTPIGELYQVSHGGITGGLAATIAYFSFPVGFAAIAILPIVLGRARRDLVIACLAVAAIMVAIVLFPGSLEETGLEITPSRALAAVGALVALGFTLCAWRTNGAGRLGHEHGDMLRIVFAASLFVLALPWMAADLGLSLNSVPLLKAIFLTDQLASQPSVPGLHQAVHDGHHHGMDGVLLAWTALIASRTLGRLSHPRAQRLLTLYTGFLLVYGSANAFQDFWTEQVVKRGLTRHEIAIFLAPSLSIPWLVIVLLTPMAWWVLWLGSRRPPDTPDTLKKTRAREAPPVGPPHSPHTLKRRARGLETGWVRHDCL
jgi:hypothetical protein